MPSTFAVTGPEGRVTVTVAPETPVPVIAVSSLSTGLIVGCASGAFSLTVRSGVSVATDLSGYVIVAVPSSDTLMVAP